ncbi:uncharacterized protein [Argopecten irradians]|uniref:uncharacterized protein n=1 Tax=Argopecten irradians TaxID=31199 RepID=UPI00371BA0A8
MVSLRRWPLYIFMFTSQFRLGKCSCDDDFQPKLEISPRSPFRYAGESLNMTCDVQASANHTLDNGTDVDMMMYYKGENNIPINTTIAVRNSTTIIRKTTSDVVTLENRKLTSFQYICALRSSCYRLQEKMTLVEVDNYPIPAENVSCLIYNCENITCTFGLRQFYRHRPNSYNPIDGISINIDMKRRSPDNQTFNWSRCSRDSLSYTNIEIRDTVTCTWNEQGLLFSEIYDFKVNVTNNFRRDSAIATLSTAVFVKPGPITDLSGRKITGTEVTLQWNHTLCHTVVYKVHVVPWSTSCNNTMHQNLSTNRTSITITGLRPFANYTFDVTAQTVEHQSDPVSIILTTAADVPQINPYIHPGSFYPEDNSNRTQVSWIPLNYCQRNGPDFFYNITLSDENGTKEVISSEGFSISLPTIPNATSSILLQACNSVGCSRDTTRRVIVSKERPEKVASLTVDAFNDTSVSLSWQDVHSKASAYTVHYCMASVNYTCLSLITNRTIYPNESSVLLTLPRPFKLYRFGISVEAETHEGLVSSGIKWSTCTRSEYGVPTTKMDTTMSFPSDGVLFSWVPYPDCNPNYGLAKYAIITIMDENGVNRTVNVSMESKSYLVKELTAGHYRWWIQGDFNGILSRPSEGRNFVISVPGTYLTFLLLGIIIGAVTVCIGTVIACKKILGYYKKVRQDTQQIDVPLIPSDVQSGSESVFTDASGNRRNECFPIGKACSPCQPTPSSSPDEKHDIDISAREYDKVDIPNSNSRVRVTWTTDDLYQTFNNQLSNSKKSGEDRTSEEGCCYETNADMMPKNENRDTEGQSLLKPKNPNDLNSEIDARFITETVDNRNSSSEDKISRIDKNNEQCEEPLLSSNEANNIMSDNENQTREVQPLLPSGNTNDYISENDIRALTENENRHTQGQNLPKTAQTEDYVITENENRNTAQTEDYIITENENRHTQGQNLPKTAQTEDYVITENENRNTAQTEDYIITENENRNTAQTENYVITENENRHTQGRNLPNTENENRHTQRRNLPKTAQTEDYVITENENRHTQGRNLPKTAQTEDYVITENENRHTQGRNLPNTENENRHTQGRNLPKTAQTEDYVITENENRHTQGRNLPKTAQTEDYVTATKIV